MFHRSLQIVKIELKELGNGAQNDVFSFFPRSNIYLGEKACGSFFSFSLSFWYICRSLARSLDLLLASAQSQLRCLLISALQSEMLKYYVERVVVVVQTDRQTDRHDANLSWHLEVFPLKKNIFLEIDNGHARKCKKSIHSTYTSTG